jgi:enoyl-CoA hydratase/carnithine racemase
MNAPDSFRCEISGSVAVVSLDRPERLNALTFTVYRELTSWFAMLPDNPAIRSVIVRGQGEAFCSGGDVKDIIGPLLTKDIGETLEFTRLTGRLVRNIIRCRKPVIAELKGIVAGAGAVIALASDLRIASNDCRIAFLFTRVGLAGCDMGAAYLLPKVIGLGRALEALYTGDFIEAHEAHRLGLVNRVAERADLETTTRTLAARLAEMPSLGVAMTKEVLFNELHMDVEAAIEAEAQAQAICMKHPDFQEGFNAFMERRPPRF